MRLPITRVDTSVPIPSYHHAGDVAFDLSSREDVTLRPGETKAVQTGIKMAIPDGYAGLIWGRSGLARKHNLHCIAGVIDAGYRGEVAVILVNYGEASFHIEKGMRIAQMIIQEVARPSIEEVDELPVSHDGRDEGGFGSTGR